MNDRTTTVLSIISLSLSVSALCAITLALYIVPVHNVPTVVVAAILMTAFANIITATINIRQSTK
jgi:hypothetical protein